YGLIFFFFFFSSRRRHTRCLSDWSSDVCSSDLPHARRRRLLRSESELVHHWTKRRGKVSSYPGVEEVRQVGVEHIARKRGVGDRSEERRVGKECRCWWGRDK